MTVGKAEVLFSIIPKPGMFGLDMASMENFLAYSTKYLLLMIKVVPGKVVTVVIDMCGRSSNKEE